MATRISVRPSGHVFQAEPSESILQAGLRAGLNLEHGCANGSCGECRARRISGSIETIRHFDYSFSASERQHGWFLMCSCRATSDAVIEARERGSAADVPTQRIPAKVSRVEQLQADVMQLTIRTPRSRGLNFLAGQNLGLNFDGLDPCILPIASCPCDPVQLRFHLRRRPGDPFSDFVFDTLRRGAAVVLEGPCGDFTLDESSERPLVFVAWESGFSAVSSLIDHVIQKDENRSIDLYWLSEIERGHYLSNYCRAWRDILDDFRYHSIDLWPAGDDVLEDVLRRIVRVHSLLADHDYYLALPSHGIERALALLDEVDVPRAQVRVQACAHP
jgi:CDP-4-dehydro-6-deoxyglucose reductase